MRYYFFLLTRYINALEVGSGPFTSGIEKRVVLRKEDEFSTALKNNRESNCKDTFHVFLFCFLAFSFKQAHFCPSLSSVCFPHSVYFMRNS